MGDPHLAPLTGKWQTRETFYYLIPPCRSQKLASCLSCSSAAPWRRGGLTYPRAHPRAYPRPQPHLDHPATARNAPTQNLPQPWQRNLRPTPYPFLFFFFFLSLLLLPPAIASACTASLRAPLTARLGRPLPATRSAPGTGRQRRAERGRVASLHLSSSCGLRAGCGAEAGSGPKGGGEGGRDVLLAPPAPLPAPAEPRSLVPFPERKEPQLVAYSTFITNSMKWSLGDKLRAGTPPFFFFFLLLFYLPLHEMRVPNNLEVRAKHRCNSYGYLQYITSSNK